MKLSQDQISGLNYFLDKVVTFIVPSINRKFDEKIMIDYFVGKVVKIDEFGFWYSHIQTGCKNFIFHEKIISIAEEQIFKEEFVEPVQEQSVNEEINKKNINSDFPRNPEELSKMFSV